MAELALRGALQARRISPPGPGLWWKLRNWRAIVPGLAREAVARTLGIAHVRGRLYARLLRADGSAVDYGLVSTKLITTAFVNCVVDSLQAVVAQWDNFCYHDSGVGTTAAAVGDTSMETVITDNLRTAGTQVEAAANIYQSVGTIAYTTTKAVTEHGLFNDTRANAGILMDRHVFAAINVVSGDSIQFTYSLTVTSGG